MGGNNVGTMSYMKTFVILLPTEYLATLSLHAKMLSLSSNNKRVFNLYKLLKSEVWYTQNNVYIATSILSTLNFIQFLVMRAPSGTLLQ